MKLILEGWRQYLKEEEEELQQDLKAFIEKNNLEKTDLIKIVKIVKSANLEENILNETVSQDLKNLYNKYGKKAITMALIATIGTGAIAPKAHASVLDTARVGAMIATKPSIAKDADAIFKLVTYQGDEQGALEHLKSIIEAVGGVDEAKKLIDDISNSEHTINFGVKLATKNIKKRVDLTTKKRQSAMGFTGECGAKCQKWMGHEELAAEYLVIKNHGSGYEGIKNVVKHELGEEYANKIEGLLGNITAEMGWGDTPEEIRAYANNLVDKMAEIQGKSVEQMVNTRYI
tara:strand:+ start:1313 stop:2179 length:867 start_codon:yes stop_codon:yes gene_type:complete